MVETNVGGLLGDTRARTMWEVGGKGCRLNLKNEFGYDKLKGEIKLGGNILLYERFGEKEFGKRPFSYYIEGSAAYSKLKSVSYLNWRGTLRFDWNFWVISEKTTIGATAMATAMSSDAMKVAWRITGGGGPQIDYLSSPESGFLNHFSIFVLPEDEKGQDGNRERAVRFSGRELIGYKFKNGSQAGFDIIAAMNVEDEADYRISAGVFVEGNVWGPLSLGLSVYKEYDSKPLPTIPKDNFTVSTYLIFDLSFGKSAVQQQDESK